MLLEAVPPAQRASWIGMKQSGVPIAQLSAGAFFPVMAVWLGWTGAALGGVALVVTLNIYGFWVLRRHYHPREVDSETSAPSVREPVSQASDGPAPAAEKSSVVALLTLFSVLFAFSLQALNVYIPLFAVEQLEFSLVVSGLTITVSGAIGMFARVWWARRIGAGHRPSSLLLGIVGGSLVSMGFLLAAQLGGFAALVWAAAIVHGATALGANVIINAAVMRAAPPGRVGRASGVTSMGMYAGFALGPLTVGWLRDLGTDFTLSWTVAAAMYLCTVPILLILRSRSPEGDQRW
ncbi:MFS transporter [Nesterenkonia pannonica]|uniref:MFS transporter n=1 Tax=Nesterenkonia pannonica TaxID=1548602 RepID=UPI00216414CE|nr:MFS transporter [Nesterenkonia pannonica]